MTRLYLGQMCSEIKWKKYQQRYPCLSMMSKQNICIVSTTFVTNAAGPVKRVLVILVPLKANPVLLLNFMLQFKHLTDAIKSDGLDLTCGI